MEILPIPNVTAGFNTNPHYAKFVMAVYSAFSAFLDAIYSETADGPWNWVSKLQKFHGGAARTMVREMYPGMTQEMVNTLEHMNTVFARDIKMIQALGNQADRDRILKVKNTLEQAVSCARLMQPTTPRLTMPLSFPQCLTHPSSSSGQLMLK